MPFQFIKNDIAKVRADALVNAVNPLLKGSADGCAPGEAKLIEGYALPYRYVIHAAVPQWRGGDHGEHKLLASCYRSALMLAEEHGCESAAFSPISFGGHRFPKEEALEIAVREIRAFLRKSDMMVYLAVSDRTAIQIRKPIFAEIEEALENRPIFGMRECLLSSEEARESAAPAKFSKRAIEEALAVRGETFSEMLLRKIDERGMTDVECYKKANIDRKHFSKIRSDRSYRPSKNTVLAFAIALELTLEETDEFLARAGFAFSSASRFDIIVEYFINRGIYDIYEINEALFAFGEKQIGP